MIELTAEQAMEISISAWKKAYEEHRYIKFEKSIFKKISQAAHDGSYHACDYLCFPRFIKPYHATALQSKLKLLGYQVAMNNVLIFKIEWGQK